MTRMLILLMAVLALPSCSTVPGPIRADTKSKTLRYGSLRCPVQISSRGIGYKLGSGMTPLGTYTVSKEPWHRFGPVLRLSGYQGKDRGILLHQDFGMPHRGTGGCFALPYPQMCKLFYMVDEGETLVVY